MTNLPYIQIRFLDKNNVQTEYCQWTLPCTFNSDSWQHIFYRELEEKLFIMQELEVVGFDSRSAVFTSGLLTTYHFTTYQVVQCIEHTSDHMTLVVKDI